MSLPIGGFMPIPLAIMIPFMATQSLVMGEAFGKGFQYGKRKISSMSNEDFNKLTPQDIMIEQTANIRVMVPELGKQMDVTAELQKEVIAQLLKIIPDAISVLATGNVAALDTAAHLVGQHIGHGDTTPAPAPAPAPTTPNDPSIPPSFDNPPPTNVPAPAPTPTEGLDEIGNPLSTQYSITYPTGVNRQPTVQKQTLSTWKAILNSWRGSLTNSKDQALLNHLAEIIFTVSQRLKVITGKWY